MKKILFIFLLLVFLDARAQWECPGKLAAHLEPTFGSPVLSSFETQISSGLLDENSINTAMIITGIDYSKQNHSLYFEGGFKAWWKYDFDKEILFDQYRFGLRELFYQYRGELTSVTLGLQSSTLDDHYLLNERIAGVNFKYDLGKWQFKTYGGTVTKDFARNGIFCTTDFIYDLPTGQETILLGNGLGDKNLAGFTFTFFPLKNKKTKAKQLKSKNTEFEAFEENEFAEAADEFDTFETNEFSETEVQTDTKKQSGAVFSIEKVGIAGYSEFGDWITNTFWHSGLFASVKLPGDIYFNPEVLLQIEEFNKGIIYLAKLEKSFSLKNGNRLFVSAGYYGFSEIDDNAMVLNSYSNILAGEVISLDATNMPFYLIGAKFSIPSKKLHIKLQNAAQVNSGDLNEWDIEIGKKFYNRLHINARAGLIEGGELNEKAFLGHLEARFYF